MPANDNYPIPTDSGYNPLRDKGPTMPDPGRTHYVGNRCPGGHQEAADREAEMSETMLTREERLEAMKRCEDIERQRGSVPERLYVMDKLCTDDLPRYEATVVALVEALRRYGQHEDTCDLYMAWNPAKGKCDCGFDALLREIGEQDEPLQ